MTALAIIGMLVTLAVTAIVIVAVFKNISWRRATGRRVLTNVVPMVVFYGAAIALLVARPWGRHTTRDVLLTVCALGLVFGFAMMMFAAVRGARRRPAPPRR